MKVPPFLLFAVGFGAACDDDCAVDADWSDIGEDACELATSDGFYDGYHAARACQEIPDAAGRLGYEKGADTPLPQLGGTRPRITQVSPCSGSDFSGICRHTTSKVSL